MQLSKLYKVVKSLDSRCKLGANSEFSAILGCELYSLKQRFQRNVQNTMQCRDAKSGRYTSAILSKAVLILLFDTFIGKMLWFTARLLGSIKTSNIII